MACLYGGVVYYWYCNSPRVAELLAQTNHIQTFHTYNVIPFATCQTSYECSTSGLSFAIYADT
jgi:hypothetical protein